MRDIAVTLIVFGSLPFILRQPFIGILMWTWLGFMNPHRLAWGFSVTMPFAMIVAITTLISVLISREPKQIPWKREVILLATFLLWMLLTTTFSFYPQLAWEQMEKVAKIFLMIFVAMIICNTRERLSQLVWVLALSIGFYGVKGGIFTITTGGGFRVQGPEGTFITGNNEMGLALVMTIPLLYYLSQQASRTGVRIAILAAMALTALAGLGTQSRGALLGMVGMVVFFWLKSRSKLKVMLLLLVLSPLLLFLMPESWYERMSSIRNYETDASAMGRIHAWKFAYELALKRFVGGGFNCFQEEIFRMYVPEFGRAHDSHSIFFGTLGHHGFPGLMLFLMLILCTWRSASAVIRATRRDPEMRWLGDLMAMTQVSLVAYLGAGTFLGMQYFDYFYNLILIVVAGRVILARHLVAKVAGDEAAVGTAKGWPSAARPPIVPAESPMTLRAPQPGPHSGAATREVESRVRSAAP
jgi:probable O-glycosylation ligase (exosortase A-associated)